MKSKTHAKAQKKESKLSKIFDTFSSKATRATGSVYAFAIAFLIIIIWLVTGPVFEYSDTWQLIINTGTTIVTFLMVFLIQQSQNKDTTALQLKLNELIACNEKASNRLIDIEDLTDSELQVLKKFYVKLSRISENEADLHASHSLDSATKNQQSKNARKRTHGNEKN